MVHVYYSEVHDNEQNIPGIMWCPEAYKSNNAVLAMLEAEITQDSTVYTHCDFVVRVIQRMMAEGKISAAFYYTNDGECWTEMLTNEYGQFMDEWPGVFDASYKQASDMMRAIYNRKKKEEV